MPSSEQQLVSRIPAGPHQNLRDTGEPFLGDTGVLAGDPTALAARLDEIDRG